MAAANGTSTPAKGSTKRGGRRSANGGGDGEGMTEYEKQRLSRIRENRERLEALGLPSLASALLGSPNSGKQGQATEEGKAGVRKRGRSKNGRRGCYAEEDDDYQPSDADEGGESSSSGDEKTEEEEEEGPVSPSGARRTPKGKKGQKKISSNAVKVGKKLLTQPRMDELDDVDDDVALQQAIAISLEEPMKCSSAEANIASQISIGVSTSTEHHGKSNITSTQETRGGGKRRKANVKRPQMTEDELIVYFFSFDEAGKGSITLRDLLKVVVAHDFNWTEKEMADMVYLFDSDRDGKLTLDDFRRIVSRCNMMRESENC